jgi:hypothetical protein
LAALEREATKVYVELVLPNWLGAFHGFGWTLHAYMMALLAQIDLASAYWKGRGGSQTRRMEHFVEHYLGTDTEAARVLVKVWRHMLMHTGKPRPVRMADGRHYYWLLHWSEHLPREQHMTFTNGTEIRVLNIGMLYLAADLRVAIERLLCDIEGSDELTAAAIALYEQLEAMKR